ncbi:tricorn protease domain 2-containing protein [Aureobasidium pullulans EXF-150]|uniref:Tricorn protease domain 2-containing protein n=1 Tax=Aureobasidium pullulans EXF-150 TaxID=1043002 RepID=A0A074XYC8_AURPU|nr:tricorn protease domain 2-containing protein [Aureobasidium pullulans EXF-150]KEQ79671.1 tricorn protease domain 2-containing protein [Aureobasidium pullulans EXF-150]
MAAQLRHQYGAHVPGSVLKLLDPIFLAVSCAHQTVMELAGIHLAIGPLLSGCYKIVTTVNQLHQSYKFLPMTLASIVATCNMTKITLGQLDSALAKDFDIVKDANKELVEQFDGIKIGCTITISLLEKHVTQLLHVASSEVPLKAQHTSRTGKWKALYNESDMKELLGQLKDNNTLLNTILNVLQRDQQRVSMSKQDKMMDMMANQEKTLQNMLRARGSFRKYLQDAKVPLDSEVASILTASTSGTALTAFDFDSIIMRTSVYKRCLAKGSDNNELLISLQQLATDPAMVGPGARLAVGSGQLQSAPQFDARPDEGIGVSQSDFPSLGLQYPRARDGRRNKHSSHDNKGHIFEVAVSSRFLLAATSAQAIRIWDLTTGAKLVHISCLCRIPLRGDTCLTFSPDGEMLAARTDEPASLRTERSLSSISLLVSQTGKLIRALHEEGRAEFQAIAFSSDNHVLACSSRRRRQTKITLYATATGQIIKTIPAVWKWSVTFSFVQSDQRLLIRSPGGKPRLWDMTTCTFDDDLRIPDFWNRSSLVITRTGMVVGVHRLGQLVMNNPHSNKQVAAVDVGKSVERLIRSEATELVAFVGHDSVSPDRWMGIWKPWTGKVSEVELPPEVNGNAITLSPDGLTLFCGTKYGAVMAWDIDISGSIGECRRIV